MLPAEMQNYRYLRWASDQRTTPDHGSGSPRLRKVEASHNRSQEDLMCGNIMRIMDIAWKTM